jgi:hypothetical protein
MRIIPALGGNQWSPSVHRVSIDNRNPGTARGRFVNFAAPLAALFASAPGRLGDLGARSALISNNLQHSEHVPHERPIITPFRFPRPRPHHGAAAPTRRNHSPCRRRWTATGRMRKLHAIERRRDRRSPRSHSSWRSRGVCARSNAVDPITRSMAQ